MASVMNFIILIQWEFFTRVSAYVFPSADSKSPQVCKTLLSSLTDLNIAVVWTIPTCLLVSYVLQSLY